jgi:hypothetical protein
MKEKCKQEASFRPQPQPRGVTFQKTAFFIVTAVKKSDTLRTQLYAKMHYFIEIKRN